MSRTSLVTRIAAGAATAVVGPRAVALVDVTADDPRADPLLAAIEAGGGLDEVLEALATVGFTDLPAFGIVVGQERGIRAFTRGSVRLEVSAALPLDSSALSATNLATWREVDVPGARTFELHFDDAPDLDVEEFVPLDRGIVDAAGIRGEVHEEAMTTRSAEPGPAEDGDDDGEDAVSAVPIPDEAIEIEEPDETDESPAEESGDRTDAEAPAPPSGPLLDAVFCPRGHPSRPDEPRCITCGADIEDPTVRSIPRPPIAVLFWDTGLELPLDAPVLVGRNPGEGEMLDGEAARPLRIADPDAVLSREHLEIRPDGWDVVLIDRGSRNFTVLERPGQEPERLPAGTPTKAPMGAEVVLAESAVFRIDPPQ